MLDWLSIKASHPRPGWLRPAFQMVCAWYASVWKQLSIFFVVVGLAGSVGATLRIDILASFKTSCFGVLLFLGIGKHLCGIPSMAYGIV